MPPTRPRIDRRDLAGPFDVIGDVHGCLAELVDLLELLGYAVLRDGRSRPVAARHPGRTAVFTGDLVNRGPDTVGVLRLVMGMVAAGDALSVAGNHDVALLRSLGGEPVDEASAASAARVAAEPVAFGRRVRAFLRSLPSHVVLAEGRLVVAHAGLPEPLHGSAGEAAWRAAVLGESAHDGVYRGAALVVHGHRPSQAVKATGRAVCVDTGCVSGGALSALRFPEHAVVAVPARGTHAPATRPIPVVLTA